ncbi:hypothetical protein ACIRBX_25140 [Kitasatospora sp. NPDC096147]|uniref:hypothetical protein n=1 Tax=Kitasatospora sp. NPDC096147 TaxID=3364093 RepID=UPI0037F39AE6
MRGLPAEALLRRDEAEVGSDRWGLTQELLAQVVELVSVMASERRLRKPIELPRPGYLCAAQSPSGDGEMARAVSVLRSSSRRAVRGGG